MRAISKEKIEVFAESKQIKYYEVSAKKGINVDIIFKELIESILRDLPKKNENKNKKLQNKNNSNKKKCCWYLFILILSKLYKFLNRKIMKVFNSNIKIKLLWPFLF